MTVTIPDIAVWFIILLLLPPFIPLVDEYLGRKWGTALLIMACLAFSTSAMEQIIKLWQAIL
jgi:hypothetical protein